MTCQEPSKAPGAIQPGGGGPWVTVWRASTLAFPCHKGVHQEALSSFSTELHSSGVQPCDGEWITCHKKAILSCFQSRFRPIILTSLYLGLLEHVNRRYTSFVRRWKTHRRELSLSVLVMVSWFSAFHTDPHYRMTKFWKQSKIAPPKKKKQPPLQDKTKNIQGGLLHHTCVELSWILKSTAKFTTVLQKSTDMSVVIKMSIRRQFLSQFCDKLNT